MILTPPTWEGPTKHPLDSPRINTEAEDERRLKRYTALKEKYDKELADARKQDSEAHHFIDQLTQELAALELERRSLLQLLEAIGHAKTRSKVFGAE